MYDAGEKLKAIRCPKCGGHIIRLDELVHASNWLEIDNGVITIHQSEGTAYPGGKVTAECMKCRHVWTLRGVGTFLDLEVPEPSGSQVKE